MKKILGVLIFVCFILTLPACGTKKTYDNYDGNKHNYDSSILTKSEAEAKATSALYTELKAFNSRVKDYDISQTRYTVASITGSGLSGYTVNGTYSLYDKYGNFKRRRNFSVRVNSDGYATVTEY